MWNEQMEQDKMVTIRGTLFSNDGSKVLADSVNRKVRFEIQGLQHALEIGQEFLIIDGLCDLQDQPIIRILSSSHFLVFRGEDWRGFLDVCSGIGGMSNGAKFLHLHPRAAIDHSQLACEAYARNHCTPVVCGSIGNSLDVARLIEQAGCRKMALFCGFPCPPFSVMGDQKGFKDNRAHTFYDVLNLGYMSGALYLVLECTPHAGKYFEIQTALLDYTKAMGMIKQEGILHLHRAWPVHRARWWCLVLPDKVLPVQSDLVDLPFSSLQSLADIIPVWPTWTLQEDQQLSWTSMEFQTFLSLASPDQFLLRLNHRCPTMLHSMGHHLQPCPCGCRSHGLSPVRLAKDGLALIALPSMSEEGNYRYPHPSEAGFLNTLPVDMSYKTDNLRSDLPLIGQVAAPLQVIWTLHHGLKQMHSAGLYEWEITKHSAEALLNDYVIWNLDLRLQLWPTYHMQSPQIISLEYAEVEHHIKVGPLTTVAQLVHAERQLLGWGHRIQIFRNGNQQLPHAYLRAGKYEVKICVPNFPMARPTDDISVKITYEGLSWEAVAQAGTRVQELLTFFHVQYRDGLRLCTEHEHFLWGDQLWLNTQAELRGAGLHNQLGIGFSQLYTEIEGILDLLPVWKQEQIWLPDFTLLQDLIRRPVPLALRLLQTKLPSCAPRWICAPILHNAHWAILIYDLRTGTPCYYDGLGHGLLPKAEDLTFIFAEVFCVHTNARLSTSHPFNRVRTITVVLSSCTTWAFILDFGLQ